MGHEETQQFLLSYVDICSSSRYRIDPLFADIWDNRVLPAFIKSKDDPLASIFHHHEVTACMEQVRTGCYCHSPPLIPALDQTLQSVICRPAHNEIFVLPEGDSNKARMFTVQGFAYNGCGTAINRVELTLDGGRTWKYCFKKYLPKPLRFVLWA